MRALVTGAAGFLGSHICDELINQGHEVVGLDMRDSPWRSDFPIFVGDIRDPVLLEEAADGCNAVYHCAAVADLSAARQDPAEAVSVNISGTLQTLLSARNQRVSRFILASSVYVHSRSGSIYRTTKQAAEGLVTDLSEEWGIDWTILRFGSLYGPRADEGNAILRMTRQAVREGRIDFWGDGSEVREYIHISDAARLAVQSLGVEYAGEILHLTGVERLSSRELLEMLDEMLGGISITYSDEPFEGRYRLTPYSLNESLGRKLVSTSYIDLGLGLLQQLQGAKEIAEMEEPS